MHFIATWVCISSLVINRSGEQILTLKEASSKRQELLRLYEGVDSNRYIVIIHVTAKKSPPPISLF